MTEVRTHAAIPRTSVQTPAAPSRPAAPAGTLKASPARTAQAATQGATLTRVALPPRDLQIERKAPKKAAVALTQPRSMDAGASPLATAPVADTRAGADALGGSPTTLQGDAGAPIAERAARQSRAAARALPSAADLIAFARNQRGETVYLEASRWNDHIKPAHITDAPEARGKRTTTWWPVNHSASGVSTMNEAQVVGVIMDAVRLGQWQNAPRGTLLSVYDLPARQAAAFGVSEIKVSAAPDGRILSAYPSAGTNVLAVREVPAGEQHAAAGVRALLTA